MERPCPEYFNGVKYNTTRELPSPPPSHARSSAAGSAPAAQKSGLGSRDGSGPSVGDLLRRWQRRNAEPLVMSGALPLALPHGSFRPQ